MSTRLHSFPVLVCVANKVGIGSGPPLHAARVQGSGNLLVEVLKVLGVQRMLDSGPVRCLGTVEVVPIDAVEEWMSLHKQHSRLENYFAIDNSVGSCPT